MVAGRFARRIMAGVILSSRLHEMSETVCIIVPGSQDGAFSLLLAIVATLSTVLVDFLRNEQAAGFGRRLTP